MPFEGTYGDLVRTKHLGEDPEPRRPIPPDLGIPEWDMNDYGKNSWSGIERACVGPYHLNLIKAHLEAVNRYGLHRRSFDELKADARELGLILCDCIWVEDRLIVWVPTCQAHGGGCNTCGHRHVRLEGL